ncbi:hypothetical protein BDK51DRAFT_28756 [Blyttiomyces helicus]|uniref:Cyclic nucleotide-binding domain-containing protein n=1 Tax=Blyttiomyces helicus TaxID=388810 RepID=A0A4P9WNL7_9FUNG|nr:hypothetical protein BDK51DRAFT_28756 [Blyttiomyces helicus]|eukprot:RKO94719.1 hypothetical protein BDK51DRAFT_28756 [Blyttiomyces helicus]
MSSQSIGATGSEFHSHTGSRTLRHSPSGTADPPHNPITPSRADGAQNIGMSAGPTLQSTPSADDSEMWMLESSEENSLSSTSKLWRYLPYPNPDDMTFWERRSSRCNEIKREECVIQQLRRRRVKGLTEESELSLSQSGKRAKKNLKIFSPLKETAESKSAPQSLAPYGGLMRSTATFAQQVGTWPLLEPPSDVEGGPVGLPNRPSWPDPSSEAFPHDPSPAGGESETATPSKCSSTRSTQSRSGVRVQSSDAPPSPAAQPPQMPPNAPYRAPSKRWAADFSRIVDIRRKSVVGARPSNATGETDDISVFPLHPMSRLAQIWNALLIMIVGILLLLMPISLGFTEGWNILRVVSAISAAFYALGLWLNFHIGYFQGAAYVGAHPGVRVTASIWSLAPSCRNIFSEETFRRSGNGFLVDFLVTDPGYNIWLRINCIINVLPIVRLMRADSSRWDVQSPGILLFTQVLASPLFFGVLAAVAAGQGAIASDGREDAGVQVSPLTHPPHPPPPHTHPSQFDKALGSMHPQLLRYTPFERYTIGLYSSAAETLSAGFGSNPPNSTYRRWFGRLNIIIGATFQAVLVGNVSTFLIRLDSSGQRYNQMIDEFYEFKYSGGKYFNEKAILRELSGPLRREADNNFVTELSLVLEEKHFLEGDIIMHEGDEAEEMYFIWTGICAVSIQGIVRLDLNAGAFFGGGCLSTFGPRWESSSRSSSLSYALVPEIALLFSGMRRTATITAVAPCILYSLSKHNLDAVLERFNYMAESVRQVKRYRFRRQSKDHPESCPTDPYTMSLLNNRLLKNASLTLGKQGQLLPPPITSSYF